MMPDARDCSAGRFAALAESGTKALPAKAVVAVSRARRDTDERSACKDCVGLVSEMSRIRRDHIPPFFPRGVGRAFYRRWFRRPRAGFAGSPTGALGAAARSACEPILLRIRS